MPELASTFINLQIKPKKKLKGQRYTLKEKIMALTIFKQSPKAYKFLKSYFKLPTKRTIQKVLSLVSIKPGINKQVIHSLKESVAALPNEKKLCILMFDEISLAAGLYFDSTTGEIIGFEDNGNKKALIADHALVFMMKGIKGKYKQPLSYSFCQNTTKKEDLLYQLETIIKELDSIGLKIIATICDQASTNMAVIKSLKEKTKEKYLRNNELFNTYGIELGDIKFFPLFDTPHLLKGVRNNFLNKNIRYFQENKMKIAKWDHLKMLLAEDTGEDEIRFVNKLTEHHVIKEKIPKMKVKYAAQVFSQRVSSAMHYLASEYTFSLSILLMSHLSIFL